MTGSHREDMARLVPELLVHDFSRSLAFYVDVIGFKVLYGRPEDAFAYLDRDGAQIMIEQRSPGDARDWVTAELEHPFGRGVNFQIEVDDAGHLHDMCRAHGVQIFLPIEETWYRRETIELGVRQFIILDPDGYMLRLSESLGERQLMKEG